MKKLLLSFAALALVASGSVFAMDLLQQQQQIQQFENINKKISNETKKLDEILSKTPISPQLNNSRFKKFTKACLSKKGVNTVGGTVTLLGLIGLGDYFQKQQAEKKNLKEMLLEVRNNKKAIISTLLTGAGIGGLALNCFLR